MANKRILVLRIAFPFVVAIGVGVFLAVAARALHWSATTVFVVGGALVGVLALFGAPLVALGLEAVSAEPATDLAERESLASLIREQQLLRDAYLALSGERERRFATAERRLDIRTEAIPIPTVGRDDLWVPTPKSEAMRDHLLLRLYLDSVLHAAGAASAGNTEAGPISALDPWRHDLEPAEDLSEIKDFMGYASGKYVSDPHDTRELQVKVAMHELDEDLATSGFNVDLELERV